MPDTETKSVRDVELDEARLDAEAEGDYPAGRVVPHERVRTWLAKLAEGEKALPPEA